MAKIRVSYNAPVVLTFGLLAVVAFVLPDSLTRPLLAAKPQLSTGADYVGLVGHILAHANWEHLLGNFTLILLVGPLLEERYGSLRFMLMILATAAASGLVNAALFSSALIGASDVAFMMILLASITNRRGEVPLTLLVVAVIFLGGALVQAFHEDQISQLAHVVGGLLGTAFGFLVSPGRRLEPAALERQIGSIPAAPSDIDTTKPAL